MLILGVKSGGEVILTAPPSAEPQTVEIVLVRDGEGQTRLGFRAAREVEILRKELTLNTERKCSP